MSILEGKKLELNYPISWQYKLIGKDKERMASEAKRILKEKPFSLKHSRDSANKKFVSLSLELIVNSEEERLSIYKELRACECINYIL